MNKYPINFYLSSKEQLSKWLVKIHNETNINLGKKIINYEEFIKIYKNLYKNSNYSITYYKNLNNRKNKIIFILTIFLIIFVGYFVYKNNN